MKGRDDDNSETIRKRFNVYMESSLPVIEYYNAKGKVRKVRICFFSFVSTFLHFIFTLICFLAQIDAAKPAEEVFEDVKAVFSPLHEKVKHRCNVPWDFSRYRARWYLWKIKFGQRLKECNNSVGRVV